MSNITPLFLAIQLTLLECVTSYPLESPGGSSDLAEISPVQRSGRKVDSCITKLKEKGIPIDELISIEVSSRVQQLAFDPEHAITECVLPPPGLQSRNGITNPSKLWYSDKDGTSLIPFIFSPEYDDIRAQNDRDIILSAMQEIQHHSCIRFYEYKNKNELSGRDYVEITRSNDGCLSEGVGRLGRGRQRMNLTPEGCMYKGVVMHELLHVIGFTHEQKSPGRDKHIKILWKNILPKAHYQYEEASQKEFYNYGAPYDYDSLMHYGPKDFSIDGSDTMQATVPGVAFGQRKYISSWDKYKMAEMYECSEE